MRGTAQALVEFALAISVFMLLVLGTFDLARAYLAYTVVANVAREASRTGVGHVGDPNWGDANWTNAARQAGMNLAVGIDASALTLTPTTTTIDGLTYVNVKGTYQFRSLTPGVAALLGNSITLTVDTSALAG